MNTYTAYRYHIDVICERFKNGESPKDCDWSCSVSENKDFRTRTELFA